MCIELKFEDSRSESYCYNHSTMASTPRSSDVSTIDLERPVHVSWILYNY